MFNVEFNKDNCRGQFTLKTLRGAKNRIKRWGITVYAIAKFDGINKYCKDSYEVIENQGMKHSSEFWG